MANLKHYEMSFDGNLLRRGFWIYVWRISGDHGTVYYIGRTGDNSSCHAASPFMRVGQHLNLRDSAKSNALKKKLDEQHISPDKCKFEMVAIGPLFAEQSKEQLHRLRRDETAALEKALADHIGERGEKVLGTHHSRKQPDATLLRSIKQVIDQSLFQR